MVKVESGVLLSSSQTAELAFLRSRVRDLEREKAEMGAENQRLRTMLVNGPFSRRLAYAPACRDLRTRESSMMPV